MKTNKDLVREKLSQLLKEYDKGYFTLDTVLKTSNAVDIRIIVFWVIEYFVVYLGYYLEYMDSTISSCLLEFDNKLQIKIKKEAKDIFSFHVRRSGNE